MSNICLSQLTFNVFLVLFHCTFFVLIFVYLSCTNKDNNNRNIVTELKRAEQISIASNPHLALKHFWNDELDE